MPRRITPSILVCAVWHGQGERSIRGYRVKLIGAFGCLVEDDVHPALQRAERIARAWAKDLGIPDRRVKLIKAANDPGRGFVRGKKGDAIG